MDSTPTQDPLRIATDAASDAAEDIGRFLVAADEEYFRKVVIVDAFGNLDSAGIAGLRHPITRDRWLRMLAIVRAETVRKTTDPSPRRAARRARQRGRVRLANIQSRQDEANALSREEQEAASQGARANLRCAECGKESFQSRAGARLVATYIQRRAGGSRLADYRCPVTPGRFHLGHADDFTEGS